MITIFDRISTGFRPIFDLFTVLTINQFETLKGILETSEFKKVKIKND